MKQEQKKFLLYIPVNGKSLSASIFGSDRHYDIALHDYRGDEYTSYDNVEYKFFGPGHKWACIQDNLPNLGDSYEYYAFIDNDIEISTAEINKLFNICTSNKLQLHQPTLTHNSHGSHIWLFKKFESSEDVREVPFVELMMPFFHRDALLKCSPSFKESESGWGLDLLWTKLIDGKATVSDSVSARHAKLVESDGWALKNGKTARQELAEIVQKHQINIDALFVRSPENNRWIIKLQKLQKEIGGSIAGL